MLSQYIRCWFVYQNQFSSKISGLCSLLIYSAFQQYITKNMGPCGSYSGFKFIRTMGQVKEGENMLIPSFIPSFCLLNTSCNPRLVSFHIYFVWGFGGRMNSPFCLVQFKVWLSRVPALWQCYHNWSSFAIPILWTIVVWTHAQCQQQSRFGRIK